MGGNRLDQMNGKPFTWMSSMCGYVSGWEVPPPPLSPEKFLFEGIWKCISVFLMAKFKTEKNSFRSCTLKNFTLEGETFINLHSL